MIFKQKRPPKHINCRGGLTQSRKDVRNILIAEDVPQSYKTYTDVKAYQLRKHSHMSHRRKIIETLQPPGSQHGHSRSIKWSWYENAEDTETPQTKITETSLHKRFKMLIISMRIPIFHHKSPTEHRHHTNGEEWKATKQETLQPSPNRRIRWQLHHHDASRQNRQDTYAGGGWKAYVSRLTL